MLDGFVILDMAVDVHAQIILKRPFLATSDYKVNVKEGRLTFDVGECHVEFALFENHNIPSPLSASEGDIDFHEIGSFGFW